MQASRYTAIALVAGLAVSVHAQTDINWVGGSSNWNNLGNWSPANVPNTASENAFILSPAFATVEYDTSTSIGSLEVGPQMTLSMNPATFLGISGNIVNNGFINLNPSASTSNANIQFNSSAVISGTGILRLSGGENDAVLTTNGTVITNELGHTIDGAGQILATLINNGVISAIDTGFGNRLELISGTKTNNLNMQAGPDAELFISSILVNQIPGATIASNAGGTVIFANSPSVTGGRIVGPGTVVKTFGGTLSLADVALDADLDVEPAANLFYNSAAFVCAGTITLNDSENVNNALLQFNANTTISGGGRVFLAGSGNDSLVNTNGTTLTIAPDFTIEGSGEVNATLVNNGLIRAFPSDNGDGRLRLIGGTKNNNGLIVADAGGTIEVSGITVAQGAAGELRADGGLLEFVQSQTVTGGAIRSINGGSVVKPLGGTLSMSDVMLDADLDVGPAANVFYNSAAFECAGTITLNDSESANNALLQFNANTTISGGGRVFLAGSGNDSLVNTNGTTLTIAPDFTIEGSGEVNATLVNNGLIRAFPSDNGDGRLRLIGGTKNNNSLIVADAGGTIEVSGITVAQDAAGELLADGGLLEFVQSQTVTGGAIRSINGGSVVKPLGGTLSMSDVMLDADLDVGPAANVFYNSAAFVCPGSVILNDSISANDALLQFNASTTVSGGGRFFLGGGGNDSAISTNGTTLTIAPDFTIEGSGELRAATVNDGLIRAFPSDNGDGRLRLISGVKANNGQILASAGGTVEVSGITVTQSPAAEMLADGGVIEFAGSQVVSGGTLRTANDGRLLKLFGGTLSVNDVTLEGDLELEGLSNLFVGGNDLINNGTLRINSNGSANDVVVQFNSSTTVGGNGTTLLEGGGNDSRLATNGTTATFGPDQTLEGEGIMTGSYIVQGTVAPGLPVGRITGAANVAFADTAQIVAETTGAGVGDGFSFTSGVISAGGVVSVRLNSYIPQINDQFNLITAGSINGLFDDVFVSAGSLPTNIAVRLVYTPSTVDVRFVCLADLSPPFGVLDLADVTGFTSAFLSQDPLADLAEPIGVFDLADINAFVANFLSNCN